MPQRTMPRWASAWRMVAGLFAAWTMPASTRLSRRSSSAVDRRSICRSKSQSPGTSAVAKCVNTPSIETPGSARISMARLTTSSESNPIRFIPVSIFRWTTAVLPAASAAFDRLRAVPVRKTVAVKSPATMASDASTGASARTWMGHITPSARRASPSVTVATPIRSAPPAIAARAAWIAPCPYPSALTTAMNRVPGRVSAFRARTLREIADVSTSTQASRSRSIA